MDCKNLGIGITNTSAPPAPVLSENGNNQASSIHAGNTHWLVLLMISLGVIW
uniref:Uncharacterized protein n=1 Tax=Rhizophora mucronata TaxID=61149 RepID=A0A2P2QY33_RHIMU